MSDTTLDRIDRYCDLRERAIDAAEERGTACIDECALLGVHELRALIAAAREAERQYAVVAELRAQLEAMTSPIGTKNGQGLGERTGLNLRISKADRAGFDATAARAKVSTSEWARTILRREAGLWTGQQPGTVAAPAITVDGIRDTIEAMGNMDNEEAHGAEDDMRAAVLRAVAAGAPNAAELAAAALKSDELTFVRWYA